MGLKVYWTDFAKSELNDIYIHHKGNTSISIATRLMIGIIKSTIKLERFPEIGQREENLIDRKEPFRYLVYKNYKIIYWINIECQQVEIVDIFDTRQNPISMKRNK